MRHDQWADDRRDVADDYVVQSISTRNKAECGCFRRAPQRQLVDIWHDLVRASVAYTIDTSYALMRGARSAVCQHGRQLTNSFENEKSCLIGRHRKQSLVQLTSLHALYSSEYPAHARALWPKHAFVWLMHKPVCSHCSAGRVVTHCAKRIIIWFWFLFVQRVCMLWLYQSSRIRSLVMIISLYDITHLQAEHNTTALDIMLNPTAVPTKTTRCVGLSAQWLHFSCMYIWTLSLFVCLYSLSACYAVIVSCSQRLHYHSNEISCLVTVAYWSGGCRLYSWCTC